MLQIKISKVILSESKQAFMHEPKAKTRLTNYAVLVG
jgi:hypothetical protein